MYMVDELMHIMRTPESVPCAIPGLRPHPFIHNFCTVVEIRVITGKLPINPPSDNRIATDRAGTRADIGFDAMPFPEVNIPGPHVRIADQSQV